MQSEVLSHCAYTPPVVTKAAKPAESMPSEPAAQAVATAWPKNARAVVLLRGLRQLFAADASRLASPDDGGVLSIVVDPPGPDDRASRASVAKEGQRDGVRRRLGPSIAEWAWVRLAEHAERKADDFVRASEAPGEGVTVRLVFSHPPRVQALRRLPAAAADRWSRVISPRGSG